ncbi:hypothetical protein M3Y96_00343000 [Aphelenchoides besseyi]|nr:hypothetical protein M3Y96_00343000 [Aphelenchoides besseyi]
MSRLFSRVEIGIHNQIVAAISSNLILEFQKASRALVEAADVIKEKKVSLHLRYLQTMSHISNERNKTIVTPIPIEVIRTVLRKIKSYTAKTF